MEKFCDNCRNDDPGNDIFCEILARAMAFDVDDEEYPSEWIIDTVGPICTSFEQAVE